MSHHHEPASATVEFFFSFRSPYSYLAAARAFALPQRPLPRTAGPVLSDYSLVGRWQGHARVRWLPRPNLLPINGLCIARLCRPHLRP